MKFPKIAHLSFNQYLNIKKKFIENAIKQLKRTTKKYDKFDDKYIEAFEMLKYQVKEKRYVDSMLMYEGKIADEVDKQIYRELEDGEKLI